MNNLFQNLAEQCKLTQNKSDTRRDINLNTVNLADVMKQFLNKSAAERKTEKNKWLPLYKIIAEEINENEGREIFTAEGLAEELTAFMLRSHPSRSLGNRSGVIYMIVNDANLKHSINNNMSYILAKLNKIAKYRINNLLFV